MALRAPLDVLVVRRVVLPWNPGLVMAAVGEGGVRILNRDVLARAAFDPTALERATGRARLDVERRVRMYRGGGAPVPVTSRTAVVVGDGMATGSSACAAIRILRERGVARIVVAMPVASTAALGRVHRLADEVVCLESPASLRSAEDAYADGACPDDAEVAEILAAARRDAPATAVTQAAEVTIHAGVTLTGDLSIPPHARGVVVFAHGDQDTRWSPRSRWLAGSFHDAGFATLLFDLRSEDEVARRATPAPVEELGARLAATARWLKARPELAGDPVVFFCSSRGTAGALWAAAQDDLEIAAVVARGGRPDLAWEALPYVKAPTLLITGGRDGPGLDRSRVTLGRMVGDHELAVIPGAGPIFDEPGALDHVARLARAWFLRCMAPETSSA